MNIAITGASGHVGANLTRRLLELGHRPRVLVHDGARALEGLDVERVHGDVLDPESLGRAFDGVEIVYHLAAQIWITADANPRVEKVNVEGTRNVATAVRACGVRRMVHFSSIHAFTPRPLDQTVDEKRPFVEATYKMPYDRSKATATRELQSAAREGLDVVIIHPTWVTGPNDFGPGYSGQVLLDLYHRRLPGLIDGGFNFVDVRDLVGGAIAAAERGRRGESYLLSGHWASLPEIGALVESITGKKPPRFIAPKWLAKASAPFSEVAARIVGKPARFTRATLATLEHYRHVSSEKAALELGYAARPLKETIADTFDWFRASGALA